MKGRGSIAVLAIVVAAGVLASKAGDASTDKTYHLHLSGDEGARFKGTCTLATADGDRVIPLDGEVPLRKELAGHGLSCKLETKGNVVVDIEHNGNRSRSATSGGTVNISLN